MIPVTYSFMYYGMVLCCMSAESAKEWLQRADLDLDLAMVCETKDPAMSCYMSQQSIETAIKAAIVFEHTTHPQH